MANIKVDIDKLLDSTIDLTIECNSISLITFEIDQLLEQTREWQ